MDNSKVEVRYISKERGGLGRNIEVKMRNKTKWYPLLTKSKGDTERTFNHNLPKEIKSALGKLLDEQFTETNQILSRNEQELQAKQKQKEQIEQRSEPKGKIRQALDGLKNLRKTRFRRLKTSLGH